MNQTYFIDIDGVLLEHIGSLHNQYTSDLNMLESTVKLITFIAENDDYLILTTGRKESMRKYTEDTLAKHGIFYDQLIMGCHRGPRIIINDLKQHSAIKTAYSFTPERNNLTNDEIEKIIKPYEVRPWGNFSTLSYSDMYHIKEIHVQSQQSSSLQSHNHRSELWLFLSGSGVVELDGNHCDVSTGSIIKVSQGQKHRISCTSDNDLIFIEIQTGQNFSENDIIRYDDKYNRM